MSLKEELSMEKMQNINKVESLQRTNKLFEAELLKHWAANEKNNQKSFDPHPEIIAIMNVSLPFFPPLSQKAK